MTTLTKLTVLAVALATVSGPALAGNRQLLLDVEFVPRDVTQVEIGDFHFLPGQPAPVHTHAAPAIGYVSKGTILYQVEGQPMQVLKAGDAFYEPAGPRILHFDNASATEEAIFTDFNLEQAGEPFIVFPKPPTERIDRRTFPTAPVGAVGATRAFAYSEMISSDEPLVETLDKPLVGYVAEGTVTIQVGDAEAQVFEAGSSFYAAAGDELHVTAKDETARIVNFQFGG